MTERENEDIETPERAHDQPAEGGREEADQAAEQSPAADPDGTDSTTEGVEDGAPQGSEPTS